MNLDDELRRLFADDRLDIPVHAGATETVLTGARRRRHRRVAAVTASTALVAVLLVGGIAIAGGVPDSTPIRPAGPTTTESLAAPTTTPARPPTSTTTTRPSTTTPRATGAVTADPPPDAASGPILGPDGFGALKLGMSYDDAVATGVMIPDGPPLEDRGCGGYDLVGYPNSPSTISVYAMHDLGVAAIFLQKGMRTPEGIKLGSPVKDFYAAYPDTGPGDWQAVAAVPGNPDAIYHMVISKDGKVGSLALALRKHECFG